MVRLFSLITSIVQNFHSSAAIEANSLSPRIYALKVSIAGLPLGMRQLRQPPQAGALQRNRSRMKAMRSSQSESVIRGAIIYFCYEM